MPTLQSLARLASRLARGTNSSAAPPRRDQRRAAVVALAVGAIVSVLLHFALAGAAEVTHLLRDPVYADKERRLARVEYDLPAGSLTVLFLGTSRTGNGFDADRAQESLSNMLGQRAGAFNFGTPASGPITHLLHLKRLLESGHRPALVLLEIHAPTLAELPDGSLESRFADGTLLEWRELDWLAGYGFPVERLREKRRTVAVAPWYGLRFQLMGRISPTTLPFHLRHDWGRGADANGWNPVFVEEVDDEQYAFGLARAKREYSGILSNMKLGDAPVRAVRDFVALCREHSIPVVLVRMPEASGFRALYPRLVEALIKKCLNELAAETGCRVADCREWMPDRAFADGHHLLRNGASAFTERLTREVIEPAMRANAGGSK